MKTRRSVTDCGFSPSGVLYYNKYIIVIVRVSFVIGKALTVNDVI